MLLRSCYGIGLYQCFLEKKCCEELNKIRRKRPVSKSLIKLQKVWENLVFKVFIPLLSYELSKISIIVFWQRVFTSRIRFLAQSFQSGFNKSIIFSYFKNRPFTPGAVLSRKQLRRYFPIDIAGLFRHCCITITIYRSSCPAISEKS